MAFRTPVPRQCSTAASLAGPWHACALSPTCLSRCLQPKRHRTGHGRVTGSAGEGQRQAACMAAGNSVTPPQAAGALTPASGRSRGPRPGGKCRADEEAGRNDSGGQAACSSVLGAGLLPKGEEPRQWALPLTRAHTELCARGHVGGRGPGETRPAGFRAELCGRLFSQAQDINVAGTRGLSGAERRLGECRTHLICFCTRCRSP